MKRPTDPDQPLSRIAVRHVGAGVLLGMILLGAGCDPGASDPSGTPLNSLAVFGEAGRSPGQYVYPRGIDTDGEYLWIVDKSARIQRIDPRTGRCAGGITMPESALGKPTGLTIAPGPDGSPCLYVPDTHYQRVMVYAMPEIQPEPDSASIAASPEPVGMFGSYGTGPGQFIYPTDVAVLSDEQGRPDRIYVSEYGGNDRISVFDAEYQFVFSFGRFGSSASPDLIEFNRPQSMLIDDKRGELIVADSCNHRLGRFTLDGRLIAWIGSPGDAGADQPAFRYPYGLASLSDGTILVAEFGNNRVQRVDPAGGRGLGVFGQTGTGRGMLLSPWGVAVMGSTVYVLDSMNSRVQSFRVPRRAGTGPA